MVALWRYNSGSGGPPGRALRRPPRALEVPSTSKWPVLHCQPKPPAPDINQKARSDPPASDEPWLRFLAFPVKTAGLRAETWPYDVVFTFAHANICKLLFTNSIESRSLDFPASKNNNIQTPPSTIVNNTRTWQLRLPCFRVRVSFDLTRLSSRRLEPLQNRIPFLATDGISIAVASPAAAAPFVPALLGRRVASQPACSSPVARSTILPCILFTSSSPDPRHPSS